MTIGIWAKEGSINLQIGVASHCQNFRQTRSIRESSLPLGILSNAPRQLIVPKMADSRDSEKENFPEPKTAMQPSIKTHSIDDPEKEGHDTSPIHTSHSNTSHDSIESDPLSPLQQALTQQDCETDAEHAARAELTYTKTGASVATNGSRHPSFEVDFGDNDPDDPRSWPLWYRGIIIGCVSYATWTVVLYSTSYTSSMPGMMKEFNVSSEPVATLGVTTYLLGLAVGSLILAPLSEMYGRRIVYVGSLAVYCLLVLPCALATSLPEVLVVRFFG